MNKFAHNTYHSKELSKSNILGSHLFLYHLKATDLEDFFP